MEQQLKQVVSVPPLTQGTFLVQAAGTLPLLSNRFTSKSFCYASLVTMMGTEVVLLI